MGRERPSAGLVDYLFQEEVDSVRSFDQDAIQRVEPFPGLDRVKVAARSIVTSLALPVGPGA